MSQLRPTLKDVAVHSGYALRTVKKVMSGDPTVLDKTKKAVLAAADAIGYVPNKAASALGKQKLIRIAVVYSKPSNVYFSELEKGFDRCAKELFDYGLCLEFHTTSVSNWKIQQKILNDLLHRTDLDGVIFQPISGKKLNNSINALISSGIPVVTVGSDAPNSNRLSFIGCDAYKSGRIAGQFIEHYLKASGTIMIVSDSSDQEQAYERARGFQERIRSSRPDLNFFIPSYSDSALSNSDLIRKLLVDQKIDGLFCTSGNNTILAGNICKELNRQDVTVVGFDLTEDVKQLMREGYLDIVLDQKPDLQACQATKTLFSHLTEIPCDVSIQTMPVYIFSSECLDEPN